MTLDVKFSSGKIDDDIVQPRPRVKKRLWDLFRGIIVIRGMHLDNEINVMIQNWIENNKDFTKTCCVCNIMIEKMHFYKEYNDNDSMYYCSLECLNSK